ncbi:MAG: hypothetical protein IPG50_06310 [Myxococcales bacterium]|nr:hypothetical protein [Myxococcales bacterium]
MVSFEHEVLLSLFQTRPLLAAELLRVLGVEVPAHRAARTDSADLTELAPTAYRADLVVVLENGASVLGVVVEVQLDWDSRKRYSWPVYAATLRARLECPVCVLVVVPTEALAKWCRQPLDLGPNFTFAPVVLGPSAIPYVTDEVQARRAPELAVLSVLAHGHEPNAERIAAPALEAVATLASDFAMLYSEVIEEALSPAAKAALEKLMDIRNYEFKSEFAKKHRAEGRQEEGGARRGPAGDSGGARSLRFRGGARSDRRLHRRNPPHALDSQGGNGRYRRRGLRRRVKAALEKLMDIRKYEFKSEFAKKHRAEGREEGRVAALLAILEARGLSVSEAEQAAVAACTDAALLTRWIRKAATAATVAEVFAEG